MFGHVETDLQRLRHLETLRTLQKETHGFTEFVPLSFVHQEAPMFVRQQLPELRPGATETEVVRLFAVSRLRIPTSNASSPAFTVPRTASPSLISPASSLRASTFWTRCWITRLSGRAPNAGS